MSDERLTDEERDSMQSALYAWFHGEDGYVAPGHEEGDCARCYETAHESHLVPTVASIIATRLAAAAARAEAAERKVAAALALLNYYDRLDGYVPTADLRAALDTAADPDTPTPTRWEVG